MVLVFCPLCAHRLTVMSLSTQTSVFSHPACSLASFSSWLHQLQRYLFWIVCHTFVLVSCADVWYLHTWFLYCHSLIAMGHFCTLHIFLCFTIHNSNWFTHFGYWYYSISEQSLSTVPDGTTTNSFQGLASSFVLQWTLYIRQTLRQIKGNQLRWYYMSRCEVP